MTTLRQLRSWSARARLPVSYTPHWAEMHGGLFLGYRRGERDGQWRVRRYIGDRKYHSEILGVADDGLLVANGRDVLSYEQAHRLAQGPVRGPITVREAIEHYVEYLKAHKRTSYDAERRLNRHVLPLLGDKRVASLTRADIEAVQRRMVKRDPADPEVERRSKVNSNRVLESLKAALSRAYDDDANAIPADTAWRRVKLFSKVSAARQVFLTNEQCTRLVNACSGGFRNLVTAALLTGARPPHELAQLRVRDFDARSRTLHIPGGKTGKRDCILTQEAVEFFKGLTAGRDPDALLLPRDDGSAWIDRTHIPPMRAAVKRAKLPADCGLYALRHTHVSMALANGMNLQLLAENVGTSVAMIEKHYGKFRPDQRRALIEQAAPKLGLGIAIRDSEPRNVVPLKTKA